MSEDARNRGSLRAGRPGSRFRYGVLVALASACSNDGAPPRDVVQLETGEVQLPEGAQRHDIRLEGVDAQNEVQPPTVQANPGDAVAFTAADAITHSVVFLADQLDSAQIAFMEDRGQMRGPPLLSEDATWIVSMEGAPAGDYRFACALHGGRGVVRVGTAARN